MYLKAAKCSDPIINLCFNGFITFFEKISIPPNKRCQHGYQATHLTYPFVACHLLSSFLTLMYHDLDTWFKP